MLVIVVELILVRRCTVAKHDITRAYCDHPIVEAYRGMPLLLYLQQVEVAESLGGIFEATCPGRNRRSARLLNSVQVNSVVFARTGGVSMSRSVASCDAKSDRWPTRI